MSLLIPTTTDHEDAHGNIDEANIYNEKLNTLSNRRDANNELEYAWSFESVPGFFKQDDEKLDDLKFNYAVEDFGRLKDWLVIMHELEELNKNADPNVTYKLLFLARHGQGFHNVIVEKYGLDEWNRKWHKLQTDGEIVYGPDPMLTELGINQAKENNAAWKREIASGAPIPNKFYVSPLQRSCHTLVYTWDGIKPDSKRPIVKEMLRETIGVNLCDKRSPKSVIQERFGKHGFVIEDGFSEEDLLFRDTREKLHEQALRMNGFLQFLFNEDLSASSSIVDQQKRAENAVISTTSHACSIRSFIIALKHRNFTISTGGMIPVVVKGTRRVP